jgi:CRISPR-associated protein Cmr6
MPEQYNLPAATARAINALQGRCQNLSLLLDRYVPTSVVEHTKPKDSWLQELSNQPHLDNTLAAHVYKRWQTMLTEMQAEIITLELNWRMVIGLGSPNVTETALTLHRIYGIPFIPGSAIKGLVRSYVTGEIEGHQSSKIDDDDVVVQRIFGSKSPQQAGTIIFFDAMPTNGQFTFACDIMTPHYTDYYSGIPEALPTNDQSPIPIAFLTVEKTSFSFAIAPRKLSLEAQDSTAEPTQQRDDMQQVKAWLQEALDKYGIGGKTSAGYGYFHPSPQANQQTPTVRIRPQIPNLTPEKPVQGKIIAPTTALRNIVPEAQAFMSYQEFSPQDLLIALTAEEAQTWNSGETRTVTYERQEARGDYTIWFCKPQIKKKNKHKDKKQQ